MVAWAGIHCRRLHCMIVVTARRATMRSP